MNFASRIGAGTGLCAAAGLMAVVTLTAVPVPAQEVPEADLVRVEASPATRTVVLRGELTPYQRVDLHARVEGFVDRVLVDRGSAVRAGQRLVALSAPELDARQAEAAAQAEVAEARVAEARARLTAIESLDAKIREAAQTPGVVSGQELLQRREDVLAARAAVASADAAVAAARAAADAASRLRGFLDITAPFAGVITERLVHPGALVGPSTPPALRLEQVNRLRLVVAVPEASYAGLRRDTSIAFTVAPYPTEQFSGSVARGAASLDAASRTMAVEVDVRNDDGRLAPGLYADVQWPVTNPSGRLRVPATAVVRTTERVFVVRVRDRTAEWVDVRVLGRDGDMADVTGDLREGDLVLRRGSDDVRPGARVPESVAGR